jgi:hypothetical protein
MGCMCTADASLEWFFIGPRTGPTISNSVSLLENRVAWLMHLLFFASTADCQRAILKEQKEARNCPIPYITSFRRAVG